METKTTVIDTFYLRCRVNGLSPRTIETYDRVLKSFELFLEGIPFEEITETTLRSYFFSLNDAGLSQTTIAIYYRHLKAFLNFLVREGVIPKSPLQYIQSPKVPRQFPHVLEDHHVEAILKVAAKRSEFAGVRDYAIVLMFLDTGMRLSELQRLDITHINLSTRGIVVFGKGSKERTVYMGKKCIKNLNKYLDKRGYQPYEDALFISRNGDRLTIRNLENIITKLGRAAGISGVRVSPHTFRHTFATLFVRNGGDSFSLQRIMGHSEIKTTMVYVHMVGKTLREAHAKYSPIDRL